MISGFNMKDLNSKLIAFFNGDGYSFRRILLYLFNKRILNKFNNDTTLAEAYEQILNKEKEKSKEKLIIADVSSYYDWYKRAKQKQGQAFLRPVYEMRDFIVKNFSNKELKGFYVHGSISTLDYVPYYSDFDTLFIIRNEVLKNKEWLMDLRRRIIVSKTFLYLLDPLQHHDHFIISEYDMLNYKQPIFPLELFKYATEFSDFNNELVFYISNDEEELSFILNFWKNYFKNSEKYSFDNSAYEAKRYIQSLLLLPTIFLQCLDRKYRYKKFTFDECKKIVGSYYFEIIERASKVRKNCPFHSIYSYNLRKILGIYFHPQILHHIHRFLDKNNSKEMLKCLGNDFKEKTVNLIIKMENILQKTNGYAAGFNKKNK